MTDAGEHVERIIEVEYARPEPPPLHELTDPDVELNEPPTLRFTYRLAATEPLPEQVRQVIATRRNLDCLSWVAYERVTRQVGSSSDG